METKNESGDKVTADEAKATIEEKKAKLDATIEKVERDMNQRISQLRDDYLNVEQARKVVEDYPTLTILGAASLGLLVGRVLVDVIAPRPKTFSEKVEARARALSSQAQNYARQASREFSKKANVASKEFSKQTKHARKNMKNRYQDVSEAAREQASRAVELTDLLGDAMRTAFATSMSRRMTNWLDRMERKN